MMLTNLDDLKRALGITADDDDVLLYDILKRCWNRAEKYCDREFDSAERTEYYHGSGTNELILDKYPVTALGDVYIDGNRDFEAGDKIDAEDLYIDDRTPGLIRYKNGIFTKGWEQNIKVTYTAGFTSATLPEDLDQAVLSLAEARYIKDKGAINAVEGGDDRVSQLEKEAKDILNGYKKIR